MAFWDLRGIAVYRGTAELASPLADDILHMLFAYERMGTAPRDTAHYEAELDRRIDPEESAALLTYDRGLKPEDEGDPPPDPRLVVRFKDFRKDPAPALVAMMAAQEGMVADAAKEAGVALGALKAAKAAGHPPLPEVAAPAEKPLLTAALAKRYASADNLLVATYVNFNRLDFAFTLLKQLIALNNPH